MLVTGIKKDIDLTLEPYGKGKEKLKRIELHLEKELLDKIEVIKKHANTSRHKVVIKSLNEFCNAYMMVHRLTVEKSAELPTVTTNSQ